MYSKKVRYHVWPLEPLASAAPSLPEMRAIAADFHMSLHRAGGRYDESSWFFVTRHRERADQFSVFLRLRYGLPCEVKTRRTKKRSKKR